MKTSVLAETHGDGRLASFRLVVEKVRRRLWRDLDAEGAPLIDDLLVEKQIVRMQADRRPRRLLRAGHTGDVIEVRVSQEDADDAKVVASNVVEETLDLVAGIDDDPFLCRLAAQDVPILEKWFRGADFNDHEVRAEMSPGGG